MNAPAKAKPAEGSPLNVYQKLGLARQRFHATELRKTGRNTFANYSYFELGDFLVPALRIFEECGLLAVVSFSESYATMHIIDMDAPDQRIIIESPMGSAALKGCHEVQNIGAVETYQRRYLWVAALEIVEHDALDATTGGKEPEQPAKTLTDSDLVMIQQLCEAVGGNQAALICNAYKIEALPDLTPSQAKAVINKLNDKLAERAREETNARAKEDA